MKKEMTLEDFLAFFRGSVNKRLDAYANSKYGGDVECGVITKDVEEWMDEILEFVAKKEAG
jgi:hypothetical protein